MNGTSTAPPPGADPAVVALVDQAREGDSEAFGGLYAAYRDDVIRFICGQDCQYDLAEDLTAETFIKAMKGIRSFVWRGRDFVHWLFAIARNIIADHFRRPQVRREVPVADVPVPELLEPGLDDEVLDLVDAEPRRSAARVALRRLTVLQRSCLWLRFALGKSLAQTAAFLGRTAGSTKSAQTRGFRQLRADPVLKAALAGAP